MKKLAILITLIFLSGISSALADSWSPPETKEYLSSNKRYKFRVIPRSISGPLEYFHDKTKGKEPAGAADPKNPDFCTGELYEIKGKESTLRWKVKLVNDVSPVDAIVSDSGKYVVTFDNWHSMGYGDDVIVVYGEKGKLLYKYRLEDILSYSDIRDFVTSSVSSRWWHEGGHYIDEEKELLVLITSAGKRVITLKDGNVQAGEAKKVDVKSEEAYKSLLARVKNYDESVDFKELRLLYTKTKDYNPYDEDFDVRDSISNALRNNEYEKAIGLANSILDKNYVDINAHLDMRRAYKEMKDEGKDDFHRFIIGGLVDSILDSGNGMSPETAFHVINLREEYIILAVLRLELQEERQERRIESDGHRYDRMDVKDKESGKAVVLYFNVDIPVAWLGERFK